MNEIPDDNVETGKCSTTGSFLRSRREARGATLEQIADRLRIRPDYLRALEEDSFADIPGDLFVRGYIRAYASELEIPLEDVPPYGDPAVPSKGCPTSKQPEKLVSTVLFSPKRTRRSWISVAVVGVFLAAIAWWFRGEITDDALRVPARSAETDRGLDATALPVHDGPNGGSMSLAEMATAAVDAGSAGVSVFAERRVEVVARELAWFSAVVDDRREKEFLLKEGEKVSLKGHVFSLRIGNADALDVLVNGVSLGDLGPPGEVLSLRIPAEAPVQPGNPAP